MSSDRVKRLEDKIQEYDLLFELIISQAEIISQLIEINKQLCQEMKKYLSYKNNIDLSSDNIP